MSRSLLLRLAAVALVAAVGLTAAQNFPTCPPAPATGELYPTPQTTNCSVAASCQATACTCVGGTFNTTTAQCTPPTGTGANCSVAQGCQRAYIACVNNASLVNPPACISGLRVAIVNLYAGGAYANSSVDQSCRATTCRFFNASKVQQCQIDYAAVCQMPAMTATPTTPSPNATTPKPNTTAPINGTVAPLTPIPAVNKYRGVLKISGNFFAILLNATATALLKISIEIDLSGILRVTVIVTKMTASSLDIEFTADALPTDTTFLGRLATAVATSTWLVNTQAAYTAAGGTGTLTVQGITTILPTPAPASSASTMSVFAAIVAAVALALLA